MMEDKELRDRLLQLLYGGLYDASPGSDRHKEQCRRVLEAMKEMEVEMMGKVKPPKRPGSDKERPESFRKSIITKMADDEEDEEAPGDGV